MKNKKLLLLSASAAALLTAAHANAAIYEISYTYGTLGKYTSSKPLVGGVPDPNNALQQPPYGAVHNIPVVPVEGKGWMDTATGKIFLGPIDIEVNVTSGSYGTVGWSQTLNGSFNSNVFTMVGDSTINGGSMVCELPGSACDGVGGIGAAPVVLKPPQKYTEPGEDEFGDPTMGGPLIPINTITFSSLTPGGTGQYLFEDDVPPAYNDTTINITVGNIVYVPVPSAAWLFAPSLLSLFAHKRFRRQ